MSLLWVTFLIVPFLFLILIVLLVFILLPLIIARSPYLLRKTLFNTGGAATNKLYYDENAKLGVRNFYVTIPSNTSEEITIGIYHFLPQYYVLNHTEKIPLEEYKELLHNSPYNVLLIFHGIGQSRASFSDKYGILSRIFHVIVFDYRCFGDSTKAELTENGLISDCVLVYKWLRNNTSSSIYVWGQSLGSVLCVNTVFTLEKENIIPKGMIIESGFTSIRDAVLDSPLGKISSWTPWFSLLLESYEKNGLCLNTIMPLSDIKCPVMIMHAADDKMIPLKQGMQLYEVVMNRSIKVNIAKFLPIAAMYECGHDFIYEFPAFSKHIVDFISTCEKEFDSTI
ncbi:hypothetical protein WA026_015081 [Henosepilachna vigintioctopunctata]|uniref:AB hydrolase-1 domain-containing protein n=1 Tax=Henosepilachna vigintioctopunctata TaxID=420089 RepID=A0AAW1U862_9CUCU